jgi:hypothetical protein
MVLEKDRKDQMDKSSKKLEVLLTVKEKRNILDAIQQRRANWVCHICLLKHVIERKKI